MQPSRVNFCMLVAVCSLSASTASGASYSTSSVSAIAGGCLRTALECMMQSPEAHPELSRWGRAEDPASDCKFVCSNETLSIQVPGTYHGLAPSSKNLLAPRVLQDITGNFSIEVKVRCFAPPASGSSVNPTSATDSFVGSGLLVWYNEKSFFRLVQAANGDRQQKLIQLRVGDRLIFENVYEFKAEYLYLKVFRSGKLFGVAVSEDGKRWLAPSVSSMPSLYSATEGYGESVRAGVVVVNAINQEIQGEFQELKITNDPECSAHDIFRASLEFPKTPLAELRDPRVQQALQLNLDLLAALKEFDTQQRSTPVSNRPNENSSPIQDQSLKAWASFKPMLTTQQSQRLAGLELQRFGPSSLLLDIVQDQMNFDEHQLSSIANARKLLEESVALRGNSSTRTPESESKYRELRLQAHEILCEVARSASQARIEKLKGDPFSFNLPGMIGPEDFALGHPLGPLADILRQPAVQQELRLSRGATAAIEKFLELKSRVIGGTIESLELDISDNPSVRVIKAWDDAYKNIAGIRRELELECNKRLSAEQNSRLQQILFQALGPHALLVSDSARDALELTELQREELRQIEQRLAESQNFSNLICRSLRTACDVSKLLNEQQLEKIQRLKGETFRFVAVNR